MTENAWMEEVLASDVWGIEKYLKVVSPLEDARRWKLAVDILEDLGHIAERLLNDPLLLALTDAKVRAEEELARAQDRLERSEGDELHPRERERFDALLRCSGALSNAYALAYDEPDSNYGKSEMLQILGELSEEADEAVKRYRAECGLPEL